MGTIRVRIICLADEDHPFIQYFAPAAIIPIGAQLRALADHFFRLYGDKEGWTVQVSHLPDGVPAEVGA